MEIRILLGLLSVTGIMILGTTVVRVNAEDPVFGQPIKLTDTASAQFAQIAVSGNYVYVVWEGNRNVDPGANFNAEIFFRVSDDNGETFSPAIDLSNIYGFSTDPTIAAYGNNVYVLWVEALPIECTNGKLECLNEYDVYFRASNDNGATFGPIINLSNNDGLSYRARMAVSEGSVYVVWKDNSPNDDIYCSCVYDIFFRASNDNGASFGDTVNLTPGITKVTYDTEIDAYGSNVAVVWSERTTGDSSGGPEVIDDILLRMSTDSGNTFGPVANLSNNKAGSYGIEPDIAVSGSSVYVSWVAKGAYVLFRASNDSGATFSDTINLGAGREQSLIASDTNVYVLMYFYYYTSNDDIFFRASKDSGATFGDTINLSDNSGASVNPRMVASGNNAYVVWQDLSHVLFRTINADGIAGNILDLSKVGTSAVPKIAVSGNYLHVVWSAAVYDEHFDLAYTRSPPTENSLVPTPPSDPSPPSPSPSPSPDPSDTLEIGIDVKPASTSDTVNCVTQKGSISVGLYTEDGFDAQDVDISTIELQGVEAKKYLLKDLDSDGDLDGVARFKKADLCESGEILSLSSSINVKLSGLRDDGTQFEGTDTIRFRR